MKKLAEVLELVTDKKFDTLSLKSEFKNYSEEFVKEFRDIEEDEHLWIGAVTYFYNG